MEFGKFLGAMCRKSVFPKTSEIGHCSSFVYEVRECPLVWPYIPKKEDP